MITAPGYERLVTHVFRDGDKYLDSDAVFGVRSSLVAEWVHHEEGEAPDGTRMDTPFSTLGVRLRSESLIMTPTLLRHSYTARGPRASCSARARSTG